MSIGGVGSHGGAVSLINSGGMSASSRDTRSKAVVESVAQLFGMTPDGLRREIDSGRTMMDIASEKGISSMDLLKTIKAAMLLAQPGHSHSVAESQARHDAHRVAGQVGSASGSATSSHGSASGHVDAHL